MHLLIYVLINGDISFFHRLHSVLDLRQREADNKAALGILNNQVIVSITKATEQIKQEC